jgi:hypothetical protein
VGYGAHASLRMCTQDATQVCHSGLKRLLCLPCFRVLPVQPYETMGSVLIEYDVRVHPGVLTEGGRRIVGGTGRLVWLNASFERSCLILFSGVK